MSDSKRIKIVADDKIPYLSGCLEPFCDVQYLPAKAFSAERVAKADALIVRTTVGCNAQLLNGSSVQLIATATIGFDHIDTHYCALHHIEWRNAPGCNARSVAQYIAASLAMLRQQGAWDYRNRTIGIVGLGHVGSEIAKVATALGMRVLAYDPFRSHETGNTSHESDINLVSLAVLAQEADLISFHTPLTRPGESPFPTYHIANDNFFHSLQRTPLIINSARGGVVCEQALLAALERGKVGGALIDCWENEPHINPHLLQKGVITTPHIAGYSADGKWNGTRQSIESIGRFFNLPMLPLPSAKPTLPHPTIDLHAIDPDNQVDHALLASYPNLVNEIADLRRSPSEFHTFRDNYQLRREPSAYTVRGADPKHFETLRRLGFQCDQDEVVNAPTL